MNRQLEQLVEEARLWNALPLLFHVLDKDSTPIPQSLASSYRMQYMQNYLSATIFLRELKNVLDSFAEMSIDVIVLKGAALNANLYPSVGLRPMRDIDLLIHQDDLEESSTILGTLGYEYCLPPARQGIENLQGEGAFVKHGEIPIVIEPHWTLGPTYPYSGRIEAQGLWRRARSVNLAGTDMLVLCPEDSLLHACLHLLQHGQSFRLVPACDIAELIHRYQGSLDWEAFLNRVLEFELCLPVQYSLKKSFELFHPPVPDSVFSELSSYEPSRFEKRVFGLLAGLNGPVGELNLAKLLTIPGIAKKFRYLGSVILPSRQWLMSYYSSAGPNRFKLYTVHMKNVLMTGSKAVFRLAFH